MYRFRLFVCALLLALWLPLSYAADEPVVAAASDLKFVLTEMAARFQQQSGHRVRLAFGSSGNFTQQIEQGAPFELFMSADESYVFKLSDAGLTQDRGVLYAVGRVVLFAPQGSRLKVDARLEDLAAAIQDGRLKRFAIANPEHAPYGRAARAVLQHAGLWETIQPRLVLGENATQATLFAASGSSEGGIVPLSLARAEEVAGLGSSVLIPAEWHAQAPLRQRMVLLKSAGVTASAFYEYLQTPAVRETFSRYGFALPGESAE